MSAAALSGGTAVLVPDPPPITATAPTSPAAAETRAPAFSPAILTLSDVSLSLGGVAALSGISLLVAEREIRAIIGPNGAGKSSLINLISGVYRAGKGTVGIGDRHYHAVPTQKLAALGMVRTFQNLALFPGLSVIDNVAVWLAHRSRHSTVLLDRVKVPKTHLVPGYKGYDRPTADGPIFQIIQAVGDLRLRLNAAEALLDKAGLAVDRAVAEPTADSGAAAQIAVAEAKVLTTEAALAATNVLLELAGTRSTLAEHNLDRHGRNARTHTLHDPVRWKYAILGNYYLNGVNPPLHAWS